jgi:vitamin B12 transporter
MAFTPNHASEGEAEELHMSLTFSRAAAASLCDFFRSRSHSLVSKILPVALLLSASMAQAVIVRGRVTDALGKPLPGARVQIVEDGKVIALGYAGPDGTYEIRSAQAGRFTLLGSSAGFLPSVGENFYSGALDVLQRDVVLAPNSVRQEVSVTATGKSTPLPQLTAPVSVIPGEAFATRLGVIDEMRLTPGAFLVQSGQTGSVTSLFMRGGNSTANLVLIDGIPAIDVGGTFDFGTVSSTGIGHMELYRGPDSAIYGTDAAASVITIDTPRGTSLTPVLTYSGDAGTLHTWRNEATLGGTLQKFDYFGAFSRLDTSNALQNDRYHSGTAAANLGYAFNANTSVRFTIRNADSVEGVPNAHDFYGVAQNAREADQDIYSGITLENTLHDGWHNLVRYGIARKREQSQLFANAGTPITFGAGTPYAFTEYYGDGVTIRGANGYTATGQAAFLGSAGDHYDQDSNRDQLYYQSDYAWSPHFSALFGFRYDNERGSFNDYTSFGTSNEATQRTNFEYNLQLQGEFFSRLFYSAGGAIEKNHLYGIAGTPKIGLAYVPVQPAAGLFHGTKLRFNVATGVQEPTLALEHFSLYDQLEAAGDTATIAEYHIGPDTSERARTYDYGIDQNVWGTTLVLHAAYFRNTFDHQLEGISPITNYTTGVSTIPSTDIVLPAADSVYTVYLNSLAYRAQGAELQLEWQPRHNVLVRGGYTYLATRVVQSFSGDVLAAQGGVPTENPNLPGIAIGADSPLIGARVFRRPPNSGYASVAYLRHKWSATAQAAMASRSDDSTYLDGFDTSFGNTLILPNRDLDFGYVRLGLAGTYELPHHIQLFTQLDNLLNDQHIGPIGYPGLPFTARAGVKLRLGGE